MSDQRRFRRKSGRLASGPIQDFLQIGLTAQDPSIPNLPLETAAAAGVTGVASITEADDTLVATATLALAAAGVSTEAADTATAAATLALVAGATATEGDDTLAATATLALVATQASTEADDSRSATATLALGAAAATTEADDTLVATAVLALAAAGAATEADDTGTAAATLALAAAAGASEQDDTLDAQATISGDQISGAASVTEEDDTLSAQGVLSAPARPAASEGSWTLLSAEAPKPRRRAKPALLPFPEIPRHAPHQAAAPIAAAALPGLRLVADAGSIIREQLLGELAGMPGADAAALAEIRRRKNEELAIALLLAA